MFLSCFRPVPGSLLDSSSRISESAKSLWEMQREIMAVLSTLSASAADWKGPLSGGRWLMWYSTCWDDSHSLPQHFCLVSNKCQTWSVQDFYRSLRLGGSDAQRLTNLSFISFTIVICCFYRSLISALGEKNPQTLWSLIFLTSFLTPHFDATTMPVTGNKK